MSTESPSPPPKKFKCESSEEVISTAVNSILPGDHSDNDASAPENHNLENAQDSGYDTKSSNESCPMIDTLAIQGSSISECDVPNGALLSSQSQRHNVTDSSKSVEHSDYSSYNTSQSHSSHSEIIADHYNSLEEKGLRARDNSRIIHMRNFNNWIKSTLLSGFIKKVKASKKEGEDINVLDMGCGKGGDLYKWRDGGVTYAIFADLAETSVRQCEKRYEDLKRRPGRRLFDAEFISADCTRVHLSKLYKKPSIQLDLVSCQFAFHYCWESLAQAECMLKNASECLKVGGFFVGTCPNANTIMSRLRKNGGKSFGNSVYKIEFEHEYPDGVTPPLFGAKYNFHLEGVVDCPEFLVHFPTLRELAGKYGFQIVTKVTFASFYKTKLEEKSEEYDKLLHRMNALEAYPNDKLVAPEEEYSHAEEFIKKQANGPFVVGTLSRSEWEAISLYLVFAFKKFKEMDADR